MAAHDCLFCRIIAGEIPADIIYEDDACLAFRDLNPQAPVHVLIIPRQHIASLSEAKQTNEIALGGLLLAAARVAKSEKLSEAGYRTVINTGAGAGQSVFHLHLHVIGGRTLNWPPG